MNPNKFTEFDMKTCVLQVA